MYTTQKHGRAEYGRYMQIPEASLSGLVEGSDSIPLSAQRFASFVYSVNPSQISLSGATINIDSVGIDDTGVVKVSGDQLKVFDKSVVDLLTLANIKDNYSRVIQKRSTDTYIAHAPIGTPLSASNWRVQKIDVDGNRQWADSGQFTQTASGELSGLMYNY